MGLLYNTTLLGTNFKSALIVAPAALALIVLLLWFGSIRNPDPVSADDGRALSDCPQASLEPCKDTALKAMPIIGLAPENAGDSTTTGQSLWATSTLDSGTGSEKCLLPGIPCLHDTGTSFVPIEDQENGRCIFVGNPCYPDPDPGSNGQSASVSSGSISAMSGEKCPDPGNSCSPIGWLTGQSLFQGDLKTY